MRTSVIIGVLHMSIAVMVKGINACFWKDNMVFIFEVVTGLVILNGLFGWMDILIMAKWLFTTNVYSTDPLQVWYIANLPAVITVMINNFMKRS